MGAAMTVRLSALTQSALMASRPEPVEAEEAEAPAPDELATEKGGSRRPLLMRLLQLAALSVVAGLIGLLVWKVVAAGRGSDLLAKVRAGEKPPAPSFALPVIWERRETWPPELRGALADGRLTSRELRGYPVVVNFWASWCGPCKTEAPILAASARAHAGKVVFLGIDVQDFKSDAVRFLERYDVTYVSVRDSSSGTYDAYGLTGLPETYYIDAKGRLIAHSLGELSRAELERGIAASMEASG
jgi:cytochrome c biogenesis protein CcmG, thiol:disulfide interchange protein DsbE